MCGKVIITCIFFFCLLFLFFYLLSSLSFVSVEIRRDLTKITSVTLLSRERS